MSRQLNAMRALESEEQIQLKRAVSLFRWKPTTRALSNYVRRGLYVPDAGQRVYLEAFRSAKGWITSRQAVERFLVRLNGGE